MKYITLTASEVIDGSKVELGKIENFPVPETVDEVMAMVELDNGCNEAEIVACFNYGWKVKSQAKIRAGGDSKSPTSRFKKASLDTQEKILAKAKELGLL